MAEISKIQNVGLSGTSAPKGVEPQKEETDYSTFGLGIIKEDEEKDLGAIKLMDEKKLKELIDKMKKGEIKLPDEKKLKEIADKIKKGEIKPGAIKPIDIDNVKLPDGKDLKEVIDDLLKKDDQLNGTINENKIKEAIADLLKKGNTLEQPIDEKKLQEILDQINKNPDFFKDNKVDGPKILPYYPNSPKNKGITPLPLPYSPDSPENKGITPKPLPYKPADGIKLDDINIKDIMKKLEPNTNDSGFNTSGEYGLDPGFYLPFDENNNKWGKPI